MTKEPTDPSDLTGTVLAGRYRILRKLGEGAMGAVYEGEHLRIGRRDAIKVLLAAPTDAEAVARFDRGARNLSAIRHPNVCTLYDYGETEHGSPFLALEMIDGESLLEVLEREGTLPPARAIGIARQIAAALQAAHDADIVHRDLKPGNVMIERGRDGSDVVKVVDFDIAKGPEPESAEEVTRLGYMVGTPAYVSPEQLMGERLDGRSDVYSLGIVLFRMLSGALPFRGENTEQVMLRRLTTPPLTIEEVSEAASNVPGMQAVLDRALARDREDRWQTAAEFATRLGELLPDVGAPDSDSRRDATDSVPPAEKIPATVASAPDRDAGPAPEPGPRWRWWIAAAAVLVAAGTYAFWPHSAPTVSTGFGIMRILGDLPDGASVTALDEQGNVEELSGDSVRLPSGMHTFMFAAPGYETDSIRIEVTPDGRHSWSPAIVRTSQPVATGTIVVSGDLPAGATVTASDAEGNVTDLTSDPADVPVGRYTLAFRAPNHLADQKTIDLEPGATETWTPRIRPETRVQIEIEDAEAVLNRLLDRLDLVTATAEVQAARDSASEIYARQGVTDDTRALAATVVARAFGMLGNATECARWVGLVADNRPEWRRTLAQRVQALCEPGR